MQKPYQLSLERIPGRYTDPEWHKELKASQLRNANLRLTATNFPIQAYKAGK